MKNIGKRIVIIILVIVCIGGIISGSALCAIAFSNANLSLKELLPRSYKEVLSSEEISLDGISDIYVKNIASEVYFETADSDSNTAHIEMSGVVISLRNKTPEIMTTQNSSDMEISLNYGINGFVGLNIPLVSLKITLPSAYEGNIFIENCAGNIDLFSDSSFYEPMARGISFENCAGNINAAGYFEDISFYNCFGQKRVTTGSFGNIEVENCAGFLDIIVPGDISAEVVVESSLGHFTSNFYELNNGNYGHGISNGYYNINGGHNGRIAVSNCAGEIQLNWHDEKTATLSRDGHKVEYPVFPDDENDGISNETTDNSATEPRTEAQTTSRARH